ncbi:MAG: tetratricopeptide repeat protein [Opitutaceae bacterium]
MPFYRFLTPAWMLCVCAFALHAAEPAGPDEETPAETAAPAAEDTAPETDPPVDSQDASDVDAEQLAARAAAASFPVATPAAPASQPQPPPAPIIIQPDFSPLLQANSDLSARMAAMERVMLAQSEREAAVYRDTNRLITIFGISVAALGALALVAAGFLNYRLLRSAQPQFPSPVPPSRSPMGLPEPEADVPGMERVRASGQRFQSKMNSLEARLAEMEHMTGVRAAAPVSSALASVSIEDDEVDAPPRRERVIPVAGILVHKAETLVNLGKHDQALTVLDQALDAGATGAEVHLARGRVFERTGKFADALREYDAALNGEENNTSALLLKAGVLNRQERFEEALACYERAIQVNRESN